MGLRQRLVRADSTEGVLIWAQTSALARSGRPLAFVASFDPETVDPWLDRAYLLTTYRSPPSGDSVQALQTPALVALDSSRLVALRRRKKAKWDNHISLVLVDPSGKNPWSIETTLEEAQRFIDVLWIQRTKSNLRPDTARVRSANPLAEGTCPVALPGNPQPEFPDRLVGLSGEVWMTYVVLPDGTTDSTSFRAVLFDNARFAEAAFQALRHAHFRPATLGGQPVAVQVSQRVTFRTQ